ncbi:NUDIX hydrolase [Candidatus Pacearchaeota archaeon]|jgi:8-oxo-dGTP pyrophosphatase MutT (NUDIX family)|nr:NUDIX hydrolase [Candidatus Pacearchaeota archaeon]
MKAIYAKEPFPTTVTKTIFLCGPTPRGNPSWKDDVVDARNSWKDEVLKGMVGWRSTALHLLQNFDGHVFVPEPRDGKWSATGYEDQIDWEEEGMNRADAIVFWVPRDMHDMPALTTNVEWGMWYNSGKIFYGRPENAEHIRYLDRYAEKFRVHIHNNLEAVLREAVETLGDGMERSDGDATVPLYIWKHPSFQNWLESQKAAGNHITDARVKFSFPPNRTPALFAVQAKMWVENEDREKANEVVIGRNDTAQVVLYRKVGDDKLDTEVVIVKEFRQAARTEDGCIHETPGGSSKKEKPAEITAVEEVSEETGLQILEERFKPIGTRQVCGTLSCHVAHAFSVELTDEEMDKIRSTANEAKGVAADTERTYREVKIIRELLETESVDWANIGIILSAL